MKQNLSHERFDGADEVEEFVSKKISRSQIQSIQCVGGKWIVWFWKV